MPSDNLQDATISLRAIGVDEVDIERWRAKRPHVAGPFEADRRAFSEFLLENGRLLSSLAPKPHRTDAEQEAGSKLKAAARNARDRFLAEHADNVYNRLTSDRTRCRRVDDLAYAAADLVAGLVPSRAEVEAETAQIQRDKEGIEIDQGIFFSHVLASESAGRHLCHAMLQPRPGSAEKLTELAAEGAVDLGAASVERRGSASVVTMKNPRHLNAEDATTIDATETAVDLALLDPATDLCVLRGGPIDSAKYQGRRVFGSGINLTHLYRGRIPFLWYLTRELGLVNKFYRGLARPGVEPWEPLGDSVEKLWVAAVEGFAIGGHCQYLLTMDSVMAEEGAFMTLPARKEGIIPGAANLRLSRFVGARLGREAVLLERRFECDSPEGRLICDEIVRPGDMDAAIDRRIASLTTSGVVSAVGNRRAFRATEEPIDAFRQYMAVYAREQAECHFSPALIGNLERFWNAQNRRA